MSEKIKAKGSCLCGSVKFTVQELSTEVGLCHCAMCRKWGGGPMFAVDGGSDVSFEGQEHITYFDSSPWANRAFCSKCGANLFYQLKGKDQHMFSVGLFEDQSPFQLHHQIFIDKKPGFYHFGNETENMTEAEVFAKYAPSS